MIYRANQGQFCYGIPVGILKFEDGMTASIPGCVGNASSYNFPVFYKQIQGVNFRSLYTKDPDALPLIIEAAQYLEKNGVKAITTGCGFFALYQKEVADAVDIPVFLSPLLQVPFAVKCLGRNAKIGIMTADSRYLDCDFLRAAGITDDMPIVIRGLENTKYFRSHLLDCQPELNEAEVKREVVETAHEMVKADPTIKMLLLECSELPPYASAIQEKIPLPILDFYTMINYMYTCLVRKPFSGLM